MEDDLYNGLHLPKGSMVSVYLAEFALSVADQTNHTTRLSQMSCTHPSSKFALWVVTFKLSLLQGDDEK